MAALRRYEKELLLLAEDVGNEETLGFYLYFTEGVNPLPHRKYRRLEQDKYTRTKSVLIVFVSERLMLLTWQLHYVYHTAFYGEMARLLVV